MANIKQASSKKEMDKVREILANHVGVTFNVDQGVARHDDPPNKISLPGDMSTMQGQKILAELAIAEQQTEQYNHQFRYRPEDGAYAVTQVMQKYFGTSGRGRAQESFFGVTPPQQISISIGPDEKVNVPWGEIEFAPIEGSIMLGAYRDPEYGILFAIQATCPKRYIPLARGFCEMVEAELQDHSIYKGKAIYLAPGGAMGGDEIRYLHLGPLNDTIVYNEDVLDMLNTEVWLPLESRELLLSDGKKFNTRTLLHGPYGTGKSEAGVRTAHVATSNDVTFFNFHSGKSSLDDLERTMNVARLYQPSVVFIEDVDVYAAVEDKNFQTRLGNLFDGVNSKGDQVMIVMTSNHATSFSKQMLRAGRVDATIEVTALDKEATERLIRAVIGAERLADDLDFGKIWAAVEGFEPAFVRQTFDKAARAALLRGGSRDYVLTTNDFVVAANLMRPQHDLHRNKEEAQRVLTFDSVMERLIAETLSKGEIELNGGDYSGSITFPVS